MVEIENEQDEREVRKERDRLKVEVYGLGARYQVVHHVLAPGNLDNEGPVAWTVSETIPVKSSTERSHCYMRVSQLRNLRLETQTLQSVMNLDRLNVLAHNCPWKRQSTYSCLRMADWWSCLCETQRTTTTFVF